MFDLGFRVSFEIAAIALSIFCLLRNYNVIKVPSPKNIYYRIAVWTIIIAASCDTMVSYIYHFQFVRLFPMQEYLTMVSFLAHSFLGPMYLTYIMECNGTAHGKSRRFWLLTMTPFVLLLLMIMMNPWTQVVYHFENGDYVRGAWTYFISTLVIGFSRRFVSSFMTIHWQKWGSPMWN